MYAQMRSTKLVAVTRVVAVEGPGADQRLIQQIFFVRIRGERTVDVGLEAAVQRPPFQSPPPSTRPGFPTAR